jgi:hypothetical protein
VVGGGFVRFWQFRHFLTNLVDGGLATVLRLGGAIRPSLN